MFGAYRVDGLLGVGGMGQVYRATDLRLRRPVALKLLIPELALDAEFGSRFEREARVLASLNHPNIAAIHGLEDAEGVRALVLEFVEGPTLAERLARGPLPTSEALTMARQIASALEAAHERGIVHRDLKPANIKITPAGTVKVLDFGIARSSAVGDAQAHTTAMATRTGLILGTPAYMSPEQARGLAVDKRTDIWAFGCVLFEMLTGRGAFAAGTASDSLARVIEREPDWSTLPPNLPDSIGRLVHRCLQKDPADRLHDIADARIEISDALPAPSRATPATGPCRARARCCRGAGGAAVVRALPGLARPARRCRHRRRGNRCRRGMVVRTQRDSRRRGVERRCAARTGARRAGARLSDRCDSKHAVDAARPGRRAGHEGAADEHRVREDSSRSRGDCRSVSRDDVHRLLDYGDRSRALRAQRATRGAAQRPHPSGEGDTRDCEAAISSLRVRPRTAFARTSGRRHRR